LYLKVCTVDLALQLTGLGCAIRFRLKRNDAKILQNLFRFEEKKPLFSLVSLRSETKGNEGKKQSKQSETNSKSAKINHKKLKGTVARDFRPLGFFSSINPA
jgi:hypothetical protein